MFPWGNTRSQCVCFYCFASPLCTNVARYMTPDWWAGTRRLLTSVLGQVDSWLMDWDTETLDWWAGTRYKIYYFSRWFLASWTGTDPVTLSWWTGTQRLLTGELTGTWWLLTVSWDTETLDGRAETRDALVCVPFITLITLALTLFEGVRPSPIHQIKAQDPGYTAVYTGIKNPKSFIILTEIPL